MGTWIGKGTQYALLVKCGEIKSVPSDKTSKNIVPCASRWGTIKIPLCSKTMSAKQRPEVSNFSASTVTSSRECNISELGVQHCKIRQYDNGNYHFIILKAGLKSVDKSECLYLPVYLYSLF